MFFEVCKPISFTPKEYINLYRSVCLLRKIASIKFLADFSANPSISSNCSFFNVYKSFIDLMNLFSIRASMVLEPSPSMSMAFLETKCFKDSLN